MSNSQQSSYLSKHEKLEGAYKGVWGVGAFKWGHKGGAYKWGHKRGVMSGRLISGIL